MKKNFLKGFLTGLACTLIISMVALAAINVGNRNKENGLGKDNLDGQEIPGKYEELIKKLSHLEGLVDLNFLNEIDEDGFEDGIYKGLLWSLGDPYSTYYTKEEYTALKESSSGIYYGIGAMVSQNINTGIITIVRPFLGSSAYEEGLLPGDIIYKVEDEEVTGIDVGEVAGRMKGPEGTKVNISIIREDEPDPIDFVLTRRRIEVPTIEYEMLDNKIGYVEVIQFDDITVPQFKEAIDHLESQGMEGLVIDLRDNPGGLMSSVVHMLDRIIDKGLLVYTEDKNGLREEEMAYDDDELKMPITVLINGNSASASEIFAGTIQDYEAGVVVGTTSFGKGIVQQIIPINDGSAVKLTISKYYTPKGRDIHGKGIEPDVLVELDEELKKEVVIPKDKDNQLQEALRILEKKIEK